MRPKLARLPFRKLVREFSISGAAEVFHSFGPFYPGERVVAIHVATSFPADPIAGFQWEFQARVHNGPDVTDETSFQRGRVVVGPDSAGVGLLMGVSAIGASGAVPVSYRIPVQFEFEEAGEDKFSIGLFDANDAVDGWVALEVRFPDEVVGNEDLLRKPVERPKRRGPSQADRMEAILRRLVQMVDELDGEVGDDRFIGPPVSR